MNNPPPASKRYSLLYSQPDQPIEDSVRLRNRLIELIKRISGDDSTRLGRSVERELGVKVLASNYNVYVVWGVFEKLEMRDLLDTISLCRGFAGQKGVPPLPRLVLEFNRIFREERSSYFVDDDLCVHPAVDPSFRAILESAVRGLGDGDYSAARIHLERADIALLPHNDSKEAVRAIFDAVENVFKQTFMGTTSINSTAIQNHLKPLVERLYAEGVERRTALKQVDSLRNWVDGCHNYRHEPGHPEPTFPPEDLAVLLVSNGIAFTRWIADLRLRQRKR